MSELDVQVHRRPRAKRIVVETKEIAAEIKPPPNGEHIEAVIGLLEHGGEHLLANDAVLQRSSVDIHVPNARVVTLKSCRSRVIALYANIPFSVVVYGLR